MVTVSSLVKCTTVYALFLLSRRRAERYRPTAYRRNIKFPRNHTTSEDTNDKDDASHHNRYGVWIIATISRVVITPTCIFRVGIIYYVVYIQPSPY